MWSKASYLLQELNKDGNLDARKVTLVRVT